MTGRLIIAAVLTLLLAFLTVQAWGLLRDTENSKIALIVEAESYTTRSRLIRQIDAMLEGLRGVHDYWAAHASEPPDQWPAYQGAGLEQFGGLERLAWIDEARGRQFLRTAGQPSLDVEPGPDQRRVMERLRGAAAGVPGEAMVGPDAGDEGNRIRVVINRAQVSGLMVAELHAPAMLGAMLRDESPGYAIAVRWRDQTIFSRDTAAVDIPGHWTRAGRIRTSMGALLEVVHTPTAELAASMVTPTLAAVLPLGLAVSILVGLLICENGRVNLRAMAARQAELKLGALNKGLEAQVAERTEELTKLNADLVTITESVTHDLRTPLNSISINHALVEHHVGGDIKGEARVAFGRITTGVRHMAEILERVVGLSLATHSTFERQTLSMKTLVAEEFEKLRSVQPGPPVFLELGEIPKVEADDTLVRILVLNLLDNALRYTRDKDPRRISVSGETRSGTIVIYCVRDNGCGLDAEDAKRIFAPFEKSANAGKSDGMGLGLAIAERIVKRHGGRIWAEGIKGEGAAIYFTLGPEVNDLPNPGQRS
ncbi:MAG: HAMP domain-containing sensor histidine kinase [Woeseia sp.]